MPTSQLFVAAELSPFSPDARVRGMFLADVLGVGRYANGVHGLRINSA